MKTGCSEEFLQKNQDENAAVRDSAIADPARVMRQSEKISQRLMFFRALFGYMPQCHSQMVEVRCLPLSLSGNFKCGEDWSFVKQQGQAKNNRVR